MVKGADKLLQALEVVMEDIAALRISQEGIPDFEDDYKMAVAMVDENGDVEFREVSTEETEPPNENVDLDLVFDSSVHLHHGYAISIVYDTIESEWSISYLSDHEEHMFSVVSEDLVDALKTATKALVAVRSDLELKKEFMKFCDGQFSKE